MWRVTDPFNFTFLSKKKLCMIEKRSGAGGEKQRTLAAAHSCVKAEGRLKLSSFIIRIQKSSSNACASFFSTKI